MLMPSLVAQLAAALPPPITTPAPDNLPLPPTPHPAIDPMIDPPPMPIGDPPRPTSEGPAGATRPGAH